MKKFTILTIGVAALLTSCTKDDKPASCEVSVAGIAGNYKFSKREAIVLGVATDATNLDPCQKDDVYQLKADKTVVYQDAGTVCTYLGGGSGTWDVVNGKLTVTHSGFGNDFTAGTVTNNCSSLVIEESIFGSVIRTTLTKQ